MLITHTHKFKTGIKSLLNVNYNVHIQMYYFQLKISKKSFDKIRYYSYKIFFNNILRLFSHRYEVYQISCS
jgi:hypothetical protein